SGEPGKFVPQERRQKLIKTVTDINGKEHLDGDAAAWMKCKDREIQFLEAPSSTTAVQAIRAARHLMDTEGNQHCARFLSSVANDADKLAARFCAKESGLAILGNPDHPLSERLLRELQVMMRERVRDNLSEKATRAVLLGLSPDAKPEELESKIKRLEPLAN